MNTGSKTGEQSCLLGIKQEQRQWPQAREYFLQALEILVDYDDSYSEEKVVGNLARLWQTSNDASLPAAIAALLRVSEEETVSLLHESLK